jgi:hypothetical protein
MFGSVQVKTEIRIWEHPLRNFASGRNFTTILLQFIELVVDSTGIKDESENTVQLSVL